MKTIFALTVLVAGICASIVPSPSFEPVAARDSRFITGSIEANVVEGIEEISQAIQDEGLDPLYIEKEEYIYALPVPVLFNAIAFLEEVLSTGLSDIVINHMNYSLLFNRLDFILQLPHIHLSARVANGDVTLFGDTLSAKADGRFDLRDTIIVGRVNVNVGIISGISINSVTVDFTLGRITTNIRLAIQGVNYSEEINDFLQITVPATMEEFKDEVNELIEIILLDTINEHVDL